MAPSITLLLLSTIALQPAQILAKDQISQISDGQVQAGASITDGPPKTLPPIKGTSTTSETLTASAVVSIAGINTTAAVAAISSTTGSVLPTSILMAAPAGAEGATSNYTGLQPVAGESFPPTVPVPGNGTALPTLGAYNATSTSTGMATLAPTNPNRGGESPLSISTEEPLAATGEAARLGHSFAWKELAAVAVVLRLVGII